jgi:hypothetical protein
MLVLLLMWTVSMTALSEEVSAARTALLPENPCDLLTPAEVSAATGVPVTAARRRPSIMQEVDAQRDRREPEPGVICTYDTDSEFGEIILSIADKQDRTRDEYWLRRAAYFDTSRALAEYVPGLGEDAWLNGRVGVCVMIRDSEYFAVSIQMPSPRYREVLIGIARAAVDKLAPRPPA